MDAFVSTVLYDLVCGGLKGNGHSLTRAACWLAAYAESVLNVTDIGSDDTTAAEVASSAFISMLSRRRIRLDEPGSRAQARASRPSDDTQPGTVSLAWPHQGAHCMHASWLVT